MNQIRWQDDVCAFLQYHNPYIHVLCQVQVLRQMMLSHVCDLIIYSPHAITLLCLPVQLYDLKASQDTTIKDLSREVRDSLINSTLTNML